MDQVPNTLKNKECTSTVFSSKSPSKSSSRLVHLEVDLPKFTSPRSTGMENVMHGFLNEENNVKGTNTGGLSTDITAEGHSFGKATEYYYSEFRR